jgi:hypothetical protein
MVDYPANIFRPMSLGTTSRYQKHVGGQISLSWLLPRDVSIDKLQADGSMPLGLDNHDRRGRAIIQTERVFNSLVSIHVDFNPLPRYDNGGL